MGPYDNPLPQTTLHEMFATWANVIKRRECASIVALPRSDRHYRAAQFLKWLPGHSNGLQAQVISFQSWVTELPNEFTHKLDELLKAGEKQTACLVTDADWLLAASPHLIPIIQNYVLERNRRVSFLFFFEKNIDLPDYHELLIRSPSFVQNKLYHRLYSTADIDHFLRHMEGIYAFSLTSVQRQEIVDQCGGYIWLATEALRHTHANGKLTFDHEEMQFRLRAIWEAFSSAEQTVLTKIVRKKELAPDENNILNYFTKQLLVVKNYSGYRFTVPILERFILSSTKQQFLLVNLNGKLCLGSLPVGSFFSAREKALLMHFLQHKNEVVMRDTVASILWKEDDSYSDWAITQAIKRLRLHLRNLGLPETLVRTIKGKGFSYKDL